MRKYIIRKIDNSKFDTDIVQFINDNKINSKTGYIIVTSIKKRLTYILKNNNGSWELIYNWVTTVGKPSTPSPIGIFYSDEKYESIGDDNSSAKYVTHITETYYYHSVIYDPQGNYVKDGRLGEAISHGCIRLSLENAKIMYENIPLGTTIIIQ